jgi:hypothetical protein
MTHRLKTRRNTCALLTLTIFYIELKTLTPKTGGGKLNAWKYSKQTNKNAHLKNEEHSQKDAGGCACLTPKTHSFTPDSCPSLAQTTVRVHQKKRCKLKTLSRSNGRQMITEQN